VVNAAHFNQLLGAMRITEEMSRESYLVARDVYRGKVTKSDGIAVLVDRFGMNERSASDHISNLHQMLGGTEYHRTLNVFTTTFFLRNIKDDFGDVSLRNAVSALEKHLDYYDSLNRGHQVQLRKLAAVYQEELGGSVEYPDELDSDEALVEGARKSVVINSYERSGAARRECLEKFGYVCSVCTFDFEKIFGDIGYKYIHVHHLIEISSIGREYEVDPTKDLRPVCPNCHAMLHRRKPAYSINELRGILDTNRS